MNVLKLWPLMAPPAGAEGAGGAAGIMSFLPFVLIIAIFYFLIIRPQNKKQKETQKMLDALKKGDKIVTIGGIHGTIAKVKEGGTVVVRVDEDVEMEFSRSAVASVSAPKPVDDDDDDKADKKGKKGKKEPAQIEAKAEAARPDAAEAPKPEAAGAEAADKAPEGKAAEAS